MKKPESNKYWIVQSKAPSRKLSWLVTCRSCESITTRSEKQIDTNSKPCKCQKVRRNAILLTYRGITLPLIAWAQRHPTLIKVASARVRYHQRTHGEREYTDEEVLFGVHNIGAVESQTDRDKEEITRVCLEIGKALHAKMERHIEDTIADYVSPVIAKHQRTQATTMLFAGSFYELKQSGGLTVHDYLTAGLPATEIVSMLKMETFPSVREKVAALKPFIKINDAPPDIEESVGFTEVEIQQMLSIATLQVLASPESKPV